ncbi:bifunctional hydroxymethylpyrimidine kinase/phosphomethylpyrimidine kinase [Actinocatenispora comari]|uniref:Hydroxymethylpyrimidine kinase n=1 Tax=Actinocatenispora comari TaxID=2807577 RepID=A0A8J4EN24_9ACTN|nr:bifunctional hydroxymethylpyrimidine kinase/phosphomethylpyrimidine kinase [Actinocatenispora comari]GIL30186.1 hypothetical protein NUM_54400 [Actinocatenispora comari]
MIPRVLSIAGTDPTGGAGIQADLKSIAATGGYGMAVVTALVAQNTRGVRGVHVPPAGFLADQLAAVSDDVEIDAVKIGMLADATVAGVVSDWLRRCRPPVVVLDPVMVATSGDRLLDPDAERALRELIGHADLITPNIPELAVLAGASPASDWAGAVAQALAVSRRYRVLVLAKGGHLAGGPVRDALVDAAGGQAVVEFRGERLETHNTHGTGCSLSSAVATLRVRLGDWAPAVAAARDWLAESIAAGAELGVGGGNGPVHHLAGLWSRGGLRTRPRPARLAERWWQQVAELRRDIEALPFVRGLAEGDLDRAAFEWYLAQDSCYLRDYSRALAAASTLATEPSAQRFWADCAQGALVEEQRLHRALLGDRPRPPAAPSTTRYVDHLLATAARGDYRVLIAALLPCFWLYQNLGSRLAARSDAAHPYRAWLDAYGDAEFAAQNERAIDLVTTAAVEADEPTRDRMWRAFRASCEHEAAFFAAPLAARPAG